MAWLVPPGFSKSCLVNIFIPLTSDNCTWPLETSPSQLYGSHAWILPFGVQNIWLAVSYRIYNLIWKTEILIWKKEILRGNAILDCRNKHVCKNRLCRFPFLTQSSDTYFRQLANVLAILKCVQFSKYNKLFFSLWEKVRWKVRCFGLCLKDVSPFTSLCWLALL